MLSLAAAAAAAPLRDPLWNQLAALPVLTFQAMEGRTGELAATVAEGVVESVQQHALGELSDSVVLALCADGTADFGRRLTKALESNRSAASLRAEFRGDIDLLATQAILFAPIRTNVLDVLGQLETLINAVEISAPKRAGFEPERLAKLAAAVNAMAGD